MGGRQATVKMVEARVNQGASHGWPLECLACHFAGWIATTDPSQAKCLIQQLLEDVAP